MKLELELTQEQRQEGKGRQAAEEGTEKMAR
jgi:hypothetical protein